MRCKKFFHLSVDIYLQYEMWGGNLWWTLVH